MSAPFRPSPFQIPPMNTLLDVQQVMSKAVNDLQTRIANALPTRDMQGGRVVAVGSPQEPGDAVNLQYLEHRLQATVTQLNQTGAGSQALVTHGASLNPSGALVVSDGIGDVVNGDLTGDVTTSGGLATTLAVSGVTAAVYGDASHVSQVQFDAKGRAVSAANVAINLGGSTGSVTLAKLTGGGSPGSLSFTNGIITGFVNPS